MLWLLKKLKVRESRAGVLDFMFCGIAPKRISVLCRAQSPRRATAVQSIFFFPGRLCLLARNAVHADDLLHTKRSPGKSPKFPRVHALLRRNLLLAG